MISIASQNEIQKNPVEHAKRASLPVLELVGGRCTGKTTAMIRSAADLARSGRGVLFVVSHQSSFARVCKELPDKVRVICATSLVELQLQSRGFGVDAIFVDDIDAWRTQSVAALRRFAQRGIVVWLSRTPPHQRHHLTRAQQRALSREEERACVQ